MNYVTNLGLMKCALQERGHRIQILYDKNNCPKIARCFLCEMEMDIGDFISSKKSMVDFPEIDFCPLVKTKLAEIAIRIVDTTYASRIKGDAPRIKSDANWLGFHFIVLAKEVLSIIHNDIVPCLDLHRLPFDIRGVREAQDDAKVLSVEEIINQINRDSVSLRSEIKRRDIIKRVGIIEEDWYEDYL